MTFDALTREDYESLHMPMNARDLDDKTWASVVKVFRRRMESVRRREGREPDSIERIWAMEGAALANGMKYREGT